MGTRPCQVFPFESDCSESFWFTPLRVILVVGPCPGDVDVEPARPLPPVGWSMLALEGIDGLVSYMGDDWFEVVLLFVFTGGTDSMSPGSPIRPGGPFPSASVCVWGSRRAFCSLSHEYPRTTFTVGWRLVT